MHFSLSAMVGIAVICGGCSTIIEGTTQEVYINTNPAGASCKFVADRDDHPDARSRGRAEDQVRHHGPLRSGGF